jgi:hypothetical protein
MELRQQRRLHQETTMTWNWIAKRLRWAIGEPPPMPCELRFDNDRNLPTVSSDPFNDELKRGISVGVRTNRVSGKSPDSHRDDARVDCGSYGLSFLHPFVDSGRSCINNCFFRVAGGHKRMAEAGQRQLGGAVLVAWEAADKSGRGALRQFRLQVACH